MSWLNHSHHCTNALKILSLNENDAVWVQSHVTVIKQLLLQTFLALTALFYSQQWCLSTEATWHKCLLRNTTPHITLSERARWAGLAILKKKTKKKTPSPWLLLPQIARLEELRVFKCVNLTTRNQWRTDFNTTNYKCCSAGKHFMSWPVLSFSLFLLPTSSFSP